MPSSPATRTAIGSGAGFPANAVDVLRFGGRVYQIESSRQYVILYEIENVIYLQVKVAPITIFPSAQDDLLTGGCRCRHGFFKESQKSTTSTDIWRRDPRMWCWLVTRYASDISIGDRVYLWRNQGQQKGIAGVIAETIVSELPRLRGEDPEGIAFWRESSERSDLPQVRVALRTVRVASKKKVIRRDWLLEDPILKEVAKSSDASCHQLPNCAGTCGKTGCTVEPHRTGLVAERILSRFVGLCSELRRPSLEPSQFACRRGGGSHRASRVRSICKSNEFSGARSASPWGGMKASGATDKLVWAEFFDDGTQSLRLDQLNDEFNRIWGSKLSSLDAKIIAEAVGEEAQHLEHYNLQQLLEKYARRQINKMRPAVRSLSTLVYERDSLVITNCKKTGRSSM